jgi:aspartate carbamoyltransferase catalytic subunit
MQHVLTARQFKPEELQRLFKLADYMRDQSATLAGRRKLQRSHAGLCMATLFYEPSTRTRLSFEFAAGRLGIVVRGTENAAEFSSAAKGETLEDSTLVVSGYADIIVMRHKENGAAERAASISTSPIINAGDGTGEHPTQALLDLYTIQREHGRLDNLHLVVGGDLKHGRTVRSLVQMMAVYPGCHFTFVSAPGLRMEGDVKEYIRSHGATYNETNKIDEAISQADVVYWTRMQAERGSGSDLHYVITEKLVKTMKPTAIIMHPLPRVGEITPDVDKDPRAAYFRQAQNGLFVRMALLDDVASSLGKADLA